MSKRAEENSIMKKDDVLQDYYVCGFAARDKRGHLNFFLGEPRRITDTRGEEYWVGYGRMKQPDEFFPELKFQDEPIRVIIYARKLNYSKS